LRVAVVTNMVAPYRVPVFERMATRPDVDLSVLVCVDREADREWKPNTGGRAFAVHRLRGPTLTFKSRSGGIARILHLKLSVATWLRRHCPDVAIIGDASWTSYLAAICCRRYTIPYVWWSEILPTTAISRGLVQRIRRRSILGADGWLASGRLATRFLVEQGVPADRVRRALNSVDAGMFAGLREQWRGRRETLRRRYGIPQNGFALLYVGQFISRKRVIELLRAAAAVDTAGRPIHLLMAGSGPLREALQTEAARLGYSRLTLPGFLEPAELAPYYTAADGLALPSDDEPWGMVVNEALLFGKPVLASDRVGAAADLIDERTGVVIDDVSTEGIRRGLTDFTTRTFSAADCLRQAEKTTPENMAAEFVLAAQEAVARRNETNRCGRAA
jgi:glycosyltransferase involved in cell wall biosynthesis